MYKLAKFIRGKRIINYEVIKRNLEQRKIESITVRIK